MVGILAANSAVSAGYSIDDSLRFNRDIDNASLTRTPSSASNRKTWTFSAWVKRCIGAGGDVVLGYSSSANDYGALYFHNNPNDGLLRIYDIQSGNFVFDLSSNHTLRDVSAWYHFVISADTTQATASNRLKMYINGSQVTSFATETYPSQNADLLVNNNCLHAIGRYADANSGHIHGYMAEVHLIDGTAKSPTDFGEFDEDSGIWKPKAYDGSYGSNGFKLDFSNSGSLGADSSGNGNDFTATNLTSTDQTTDTPTNNFATFNSIIPMNSTMTIQEGNLECKTASNYASGASNTWFSTMGVSSGKWYAEFKMTQNSASYGSLVGVSYDIDTNQQGSTANANNFCQHSSMTSGWGYSNDGSWFNGATYDLSGTDYDTYTTNDIIGVALDLDNSKLYWSKNGTYQNSANPETGSNGISIDANEEYYFAISDTSLSNTFTFQANFGNPVYSISSGNSDDNGYGNFEYAPPSGYLALCTQNLATELSPTIDDGSAYFQTATYSGTGSSLSVVNDGYSDLQPDWIWLKCRTRDENHSIHDSTRGVDNFIASNQSNAEGTETDRLESFNTDGFTVNGGDDRVNISGQTYVAWQWKANGGTTSSNTDGSITSTVQANTTAGFSIVTYTGTESNATVGHGLGKPNILALVKNRDLGRQWLVRHPALASNQALRLDVTSGVLTRTTDWNDTLPTSTVLHLGNEPGVNGSGDNMIAYCFAEIEGYSKMGSYTGNGNSDGTFVYTGFRPAWLLVKDSSASENWNLFDNKRDPFNEVDANLKANASNAETDFDVMDFVSNGFKIRQTSGDTNNSGNKYIYMCFASNPFVDSTGVPVTAR